MGADYIIGYGCVPKEAFTTEGILTRVKAGARAESVRQFYKNNREERRPEDMGFEMITRNAEGEQDTQIIHVDELLALRAELNEYEHFCQNCPANHFKRPFGCIGTVNYPVSVAAEIWMLEQLPFPEEPIPFLLLKQGQEFGNTGALAAKLRLNSPGIFLESLENIGRQYDEMSITGEQLFELLFLLGTIQQKRAVMILLFMGAIQRDMEAHTLMALTPAPPTAAQDYPFLLTPNPEDDHSIIELKQFFHALYRAWLLDREVVLDV